MNKKGKIVLLVLLVLILNACSSVVKDESVATTEKTNSITAENQMTIRDIEKNIAALDGTISQIEGQVNEKIVSNGSGLVAGFNYENDSYRKSESNGTVRITSAKSPEMNENHNESYSEIKEKDLSVVCLIQNLYQKRNFLIIQKLYFYLNKNWIFECFFRQKLKFGTKKDIF